MREFKTPEELSEYSGFPVEEIHQIFSDDLFCSALVLFMNPDFCSSNFGRMTLLKVGQTHTYKKPEDVKGRHLYDLPSQRQYPEGFIRRPYE